MADITITKAAVIPGSDSIQRTGIAGATVTTGQPVYADASDGDKWKPADADALATAGCVGIALNDALDEQPVVIHTGGTLAFGAILTIGIPYVVSVNPGGIAPYSDLASGDFVSLLGVAITTGNLMVRLNNSGIAKP